MSRHTQLQAQPKQSSAPLGGILQRKCACGTHTIAGSECDECGKKRLQLGAPGQAETEKAPSILHGGIRSTAQPADTLARSFIETGFGQDFSRVKAHTDNQSRVAQRAYNGNASLPARADHDKDEPKDKPKDEPKEPPKEPPKPPPKEPPKEPPKDAPKDAPKQATPAPTGPCGGKSLANSVVESDKRLNGSSVTASLDPSDFGNTSKLGADFSFSACKVGATWRFQLSALAVPVASKVQDVTFKTNIPSATDAAVTKTTYADIVRDLSPTTTGTFSVSCGGKSFKDTVTTYSTRKTYWNQQLVIEHEAFHRTDWVDKYKPELAKSESDVAAYSIPESEAKNATEAVAKANSVLTGYMASAYGRVCDSFTPKKESRAYNKGAPSYQKLVDEINDRAKKEKW